MVVLSMCYTHTVVCLYFTSGGSSILFEYKSIFACALFKSENSVMFVWENTDVFQHRLYKLAWCKTDFAYTQYGASQMTQLVKNLLANAGDLRDAGSVPQLGRRPGKGNGSMLQYSSLENSMHGEPGGLQSMGSQRIRHDWVHERAHTHTHTLHQQETSSSWTWKSKNPYKQTYTDLKHPLAASAYDWGCVWQAPSSTFAVTTFLLHLLPRLTVTHTLQPRW